MRTLLDLALLLVTTVTLTFIFVWLRDEIAEWRSKRHHRMHDREVPPRRARRNYGPPRD